jgi:molecular chaperone GrpE
MPESPPPGVAGDAVGGRQETLTPEAIEAILADFRSWLGSALAPPPPDAEAASEQAVEPLDLQTLLSQLVALRHEVNLQTKAVRGQQEQNAETLRQLGQALQTLRQAQNGGDQAEQQAKDELIRPVLKTLVDVHDALWLAEREVRRVTQNVLPELEHLPVAPEAHAPKASFLRRLFGPRAAPPARHPEEQASPANESAERIRNMLGSLLTGYTMSLKRLERALEQAGLEQIPCQGEAFDPELMEVVEVVADSGLPGGEVVDEVRRGYLWHGRIFRYAQARVARD